MNKALTAIVFGAAMGAACGVLHRDLEDVVLSATLGGIVSPLFAKADGDKEFFIYGGIGIAASLAGYGAAVYARYLEHTYF